MITKEGKLKLIDFGLADYLPESSIVRDSKGTPIFQGPEMMMDGEIEFSAPTVDIYACGVILFFMLTGKYPISAPSKE